MKKMRFTLIDALIVLAAIIVCAAGVLLLSDGDTSAEKQEVYLTVLATKVDEGIKNIITEGEKVSISFSEEAYATVLGVEEEPCLESEYSETKGSYVTHEVEGKSDIKIYLKCDANVSDTQIKNGDVPIRVGAAMPVRGKGYAVKGYVIELEESTKEAE